LRLEYKGKEEGRSIFGCRTHKARGKGSRLAGGFLIGVSVERTGDQHLRREIRRDWVPADPKGEESRGVGGERVQRADKGGQAGGKHGAFSSRGTILGRLGELGGGKNTRRDPINQTIKTNQDARPWVWALEPVLPAKSRSITVN